MNINDMLKMWRRERKAWLALKFDPLEFDDKEQTGHTKVEWKEVKGVRLDDKNK